jgi:hypothetical protein
MYGISKVGRGGGRGGAGWGGVWWGGWDSALVGSGVAVAAGRVPARAAAPPLPTPPPPKPRPGMLLRPPPTPPSHPRQALETAYTRVAARQLAPQGIMVNACWCAGAAGPPGACAGAAPAPAPAPRRRPVTARRSPALASTSPCPPPPRSPGWCATDMSSWRGPKSAAAGADTPVWLALLPPPGDSGGGGGGELETGGFWRDRARAEF